MMETRTSPEPPRGLRGGNARRREMVHIAMLVGLDVFAMILSFEIGRLLRGTSPRPFAHVISQERFTEIVIATTPLWVAIFAICGLYRVRVHGGRVSEAGRVIVAVMGGAMVRILDYYSFKSALPQSFSSIICRNRRNSPGPSRATARTRRHALAVPVRPRTAQRCIDRHRRPRPPNRERTANPSGRVQTGCG